MLEFISLLRQRYYVVLNSNAQEVRYYQSVFEQLTLAEAFFRKGRFRETLPLQIAIIGPTQAGKSSLTNVFLQSQNAGVSPLAGYTIHPHGFCHSLAFFDCKKLADYFAPFEQISSDNLSKSRFDCYSLTHIEKPSLLLPPAILWDTPDFDSIDSTHYREGVLKTIALADIIILAVSKEKYADQTVWDTLKLIEPLRQPTLICINKLSEGSEAIILESLKEKWRDYRRDNFPEVMPLLYQHATKSPEIPESKQQILFALAKKVQREKHHRREQKLLQTHWAEWTKPLRAEHIVIKAWQTLVDDAIEQALNDYERTYLNHPRHYETFQQAIAALLLLLEIPSVAKVMMTARKVLLYPFKKLRRLFGYNRKHLATTSHEMTVLTLLLNHILTELAHELVNKNEALWRELSEQLRQNRTAVLNEFNHAAEDYHQNFQQDVELAAQGLYSKLEEQPLVLNTLRATRVTADAAVVALTLYTGGIGLHDLAIAPAMLMLTNLLTESAIGSYMKKVETDLKTQQFTAVKKQIFAPLAQHLHTLPQHIKTETYFAISPEQLATVETKFNETPHGLRLL
ncbi:MAG: GTPase domain-containing protein [Methylococcales bacterium]|nr:GTPase domain-containing protein [Methylococcales bacterium]MDD5753212.1 GTPase domain-containing protein [Methylococcales bacterium]